MPKEEIYHPFERFWHWTQAVLILMLALTGFEVHGSLSFFGFEQAASIHSAAAVAFLVLVLFAVFWHLTTDEWKHYVPTRENLRAQVDYYLLGIFRHAPHPSRRTSLSKLNPLQRIVYAGLKVLVIPVVATTGLLYMFFRFSRGDEVLKLDVAGLEIIAVLHTLGAFLLIAFLVAHLYLITTGHTATSNLKAMLTGYEEMPEAGKP